MVGGAINQYQWGATVSHMAEGLQSLVLAVDLTLEGGHGHAEPVCVNWKTAGYTVEGGVVTHC